MKKCLKYIFVLMFLFIIFIILIFYISKRNVFDDIMIFGLWEENGAQKEYEIKLQKTLEIDLFTTMNNRTYKKIAPGSKGSFVIKFNKPQNSNYKINIKEKAIKPQNLVFVLENEKYATLKDMEEKINQKFIDTQKVVINWEWKYYIDEIHDKQDTKEGTNASTYLFEIEAVVEE